ncbi:MAG: NRDE family protein [Mameliella sp.]|nr:NRDE family protein [Phaeodactylibacter sp.]
MCTVTYLPKEEGSFILTSNRDEAPERSPENLDAQTVNHNDLIFPRDTTAGGTWISIASNGFVICILNGAYTRHTHQPPYRRSRGLMALDFFSFATPEDFIRLYTFEGMEPFTMVIIGKEKVIDLRWDEQKLDAHYRDAKAPHIWSSPTLYNAEMQRKRETWFSDWLNNQQSFKRKEILEWHRTAGEGDPENDVVMNRNNIVRTVSITSIEEIEGQLDLVYHDLLRQQTKKALQPISNEALAFHQHKN